MKKNIVLFLFLLFISMSFAEWITISDTELLYNCQQHERGNLEIEFNLDGFEVIEKTYNGEKYYQIGHEEAGELLEIGMPDLPVFTKAIAIPDQGTAELEVVSYDVEEYKNYQIYPQEALQFEHETPQDNFTKDTGFYNSKNRFPLEIAFAGDPAVMRDLRLLPVTFCPFQYDAGSKSLFVYSNIRIVVNVSGSGGVNAKYSNRKRSKTFEEFYKANTLNYEQLALRDEYQVPTILFICNDDDDVLENLEYLTEWKKEKGFNVEVATTSETGSSNTSIKAYIQDAYDNWENPPEYVNIMGDVGGSYNIPTWYSGGYYGEGDHPYCQLEGDDVLGDVIMGRMTFGTISGLQNVINKVLLYEKDPYIGNTEWYNQALLVGDPTSSGYSCVAFAKGVKELMLDFEGNFWGDENFTEVYSGSFSYQMNEAVTDGVSFFAYRGFGGTSGWISGNTSNGYMMPFLVMPTCDANDWANNTGNVEGFYQMGSTAMPNGGIGGMGTATGGTHTPFNNAIAIGVWGGLFRDHIYTMGGSVLRGKYYLWLTFPQNPGGAVDTFSHWNTLMGDGSVELWTRVPQNLTVTDEDVIATGTNYYQVTVLDSIGNAAEGAWVTLKAENSDYTVSGFCDYSGMIYLDVTDAEEGEYILTVSKHDHIPVQQDITIEQVEEFVDIFNISIDDQSGNNDGIVNPGESVEIIPELGNTGTQALTGITAEISCNNPQITINNNSANYGDITSGDTGVAESGYSIDFAADLQGGEEIEFLMEIMDGSGTVWHSRFLVLIHGASLSCESYTIDGDGVLQPGETDEIYFNIYNAGELTAEEVSGYLSCNNRRITITDSLGSFGDVDPDEISSNTGNRFTITASMAILPGTYIPMFLHLTNDSGYNDVLSVNVCIGEPEESDPYGPDEYGYWCYDDGDVDYDKCPEYNWVEIDPYYDGEGEVVNWEDPTSHAGPQGDRGTYDNIDFPEEFNFVFYGETYNELCISSNGWVAPGHHESGNFMNYQIPGPQGPSPMIAVLWDDLNCGYDDVLYYYDEDLHFFVVEWSRVTNGDTGSAETFQVILYDPVYYPTTTGDSEIKMQYLEVNNNNSGSYPSNHGQFATVGIENHDSLIGLQYTFNNTYPEACKTLEDEMAILFTPPPIPPDGPFLGISSFSALSGDDEYIEAGETANISLQLENLGAETANNVTVELAINDPYITINDAYGEISQIDEGAFVDMINEFSIEIAENVPDYYVFYLEAIVSCDVNSWNWMLPFTAYWANTFEVNQDSIYYELQLNEVGEQAFTLSNTGVVPANFYIRTDEIAETNRDVTGSYIYMDTDSFTPGEQVTWTFTVLNGSTDNEWLSDVWIEFPLGVTVLSAGDVEGGDGGDLEWDGTTGAGQTVNWHGLTANGWGMIHNGEIASWEVDVQLSTEFAGDMSIGWEVGGDGYGGEPHNVTGEIMLEYPLRWINLDTSSGTLAVGESREITINFDTSDIEEGIHEADVVITSNSWDTKSISIMLNVTVTDEDEDIPIENTTLTGNYPNPFNPSTVISYKLAKEAEVELTIYNIKGQALRTLEHKVCPAGEYHVTWDGKTDSGLSAGSGVYFYKLKAGKFIESKKMILIK